jgi:aspartate aminotransferase
MRLAERMSRLGTESAFEVLGKAVALEATGRRVVHLEIGEPDFETPRHVVEAVEQALDAGLTNYVPSPGIAPLRESVAAHLQAAGRMTTSPERVVITPGGKPVMFFTMLALCGPGDEVIYPDPGFPMYASIAAFTGATPVPLPLREENGFRVDPEELAGLVTERTRLLILNSPQNPCGSVLTRPDVEAIARIAIERDLVVLSDEIYSSLSYGGRCPSVLDVDGMAERTVLLDGWSKTFAMTGFRLGYGVFPSALVEPVTRLLVNSVSCVPAFSQHGAIAALEGSWEAVDRMREEFRARRDLVVDGLNDIDGISCVTPGGAFYAFPNVSGLGVACEVLADSLLQEAGVACLPGTAFGTHGEGFLRLSYANSEENLREALQAIADHVRALAG